MTVDNHYATIYGDNIEILLQTTNDRAIVVIESNFYSKGLQFVSE